MTRRVAGAFHALEWLLAGQGLFVLVALFVPFGFDHPSSLGLDFGHFLLVLALYLILLVGGLIAAVKRRNWLLLGLQIATPCVIFGLAVAGVLSL
jgi:hypothetical protein